MEQNNFDMLEGVDTDLAPKKDETPKVEVKEYEKLLLAERNRNDYERATSLIKAGCFKQVEEKTLDFTKLEKIDAKKAFKGVYDLYRNKETLDLIFICELIEDNKGDSDAKQNVKAYGYDCLYIESMDNETYAQVMHAAKNNLRNSVTVAYRASWICFFVLLVMTVYTFIYNLISTMESSSNNIFTSLASSFYYTGMYLVGDVILLAVLALVSIRFERYKKQ